MIYYMSSTHFRALEIWLFRDFPRTQGELKNKNDWDNHEHERMIYVPIVEQMSSDSW